MCHGECTWADDSCVENKPLPIYKGFAIIKIIFNKLLPVYKGFGIIKVIFMMMMICLTNRYSFSFTSTRSRLLII